MYAAGGNKGYNIPTPIPTKTISEERGLTGWTREAGASVARSVGAPGVDASYTF